MTFSVCKKLESTVHSVIVTHSEIPTTLRLVGLQATLSITL